MEKAKDFIKFYLNSLLCVLSISILMLIGLNFYNAQAPQEAVQAEAYTSAAMVAYGIEPAYLLIFVSFFVIFIGIVLHAKMMAKHRKAYLHGGLWAAKE
ncbi:hypothetical protein COU37_03665 [Candidatus Micrarchaeota archaeon CG10_big_fil_rev_8_21_14_0_10_45_29]|nr:MAG: hypothetical protein COU37_03665 [Candidatus Micrarchaeota archaeon CG10_big_fil_rev_8_21_14_0_10_45_29]